jgi:FlgN protein.
LTKKEKIEKLQQVISQFSELITEENRHLSIGSNPSKFSELLNKKKTLAATYESHLQGIRADSEFDEDKSINEQLIFFIQEFQALIEENAVLLSSKIQATQRVFSVIQQAVKERGQPSQTYSNEGTVVPARKTYTPALSVGVNNEC